MVTRTASAATYYLDAVNGSDGNPGTEAQPWKTLARAYDGSTLTPNVEPGDTVYLKNGNYGKYSEVLRGNRSSWITYKAAAGHHPVFTQINITSSTVYDAYLRFDGIDISHPSTYRPTPDGHWHYNDPDAPGYLVCIIRGKYVQFLNGTYKGYEKYISRGAYFAYADNSLIENCEISTIVEGIKVEKSKNFTVRHCNVHNMSEGSGIRFETDCEGALIETTHLHDQRAEENDTYHPYLDDFHTGSGFSVNTSHITIRKNILHGGFAEGMLFYNTAGHHDVIIENNLFYDCGTVNAIHLNGPTTIRNNTHTSFTTTNKVDTLSIIDRYSQGLNVGLKSDFDGNGVNIYNNVSVGYWNFPSPTNTSWLFNEDHNIIWKGAGSSNVTKGPHSKIVVWLASFHGCPNYFEDIGYRGSTPEYNYASDGVQAFFVDPNYYTHPTNPSFGFGKHKFRDYHLAPGSPAINFGDPAHQPSDSLGSLDPNGFINDDGPARDASRHSAGCYEYIAPDSNNHAPVLQQISSKSVNENSLLTFPVSATDADGDSITYSAQNLPTGATFSAQTFSWTPSSRQAGSYGVTFVASDGKAQDFETVTITVNAAQGNNHPPVLSTIGNKSVDENALLSFSVSATDADGDSITYSASDLPSGAAFAGQAFTWTPGYDQAGSHSVTFTASDGKAQDSETVAITVRNVAYDKSAPVVTGCSPAAGSIQIPPNSVISLHITDDGEGIDANSVVIKVGDSIIYEGNTSDYGSAYGRCRRSGTKADYAFSYQPNEVFDFDQTVTVAANAADLAGNVMSQYLYFFKTEMRSFGQNRNVSSDPSSLDKGRPATVSDSAGNIWVAWESGDAGARDIFVRKLTAGTSDLGNTIRLTNDPYDQCHPAIAVGSDGKLYVVWQDNRRGNWDICVSTSTDGSNWSGETRITDSNDNQTNPAIAVDNQQPNVAHVVWQDDQADNQDVYLAGSDNGFVTETTTRITSNTADQTEPAVAVDSSSVVYVVWTDKRNGSGDIYAAASNQGPWTNVPIVSSASNQLSPAIAVDSAGVIHLLWVDDAPGNQDVFYASTDGLPGSPLVGSSIVDDSSGANQSAPAIISARGAAGDSKVFACWQDERYLAGRGGDTDIFFTEIGAGFAKTNVLVGDEGTNSNQSEPAMGIDEHSQPYVVWTDDRGAQNEIYYAGSTFVEPVPLYWQNVTASVGATIGPDPENITKVDDVSLLVPAGAVSSDVRMTISKIRNPQALPAQSLESYDFGPSGISFGQPVTVTIPYSVSGSTSRASVYWYDSLTGALSQQGITDIEDIAVSPSLHALRFKTTHFTPFCLFAGDLDGLDGGVGGGGCSVCAVGQSNPAEYFLPYAGLAVIVTVLRLRDRRKR